MFHWLIILKTKCHHSENFQKEKQIKEMHISRWISRKKRNVYHQGFKVLKELMKIKKEEPEYNPMLIFVVKEIVMDLHQILKDPIYSNELKKAYESGLQ